MRAGVYARISEDRDETQLGVKRQIEDCEALARQRGWNIVDRYVDNDISAYKRGRRPEYQRLLQDIAAKHINAVVIWHQDRLHRQPRELEEFFDICDRAGLANLATVSGDIDLGTHEGRFTARIMGAVARKASDDQSRRLLRKALELARDGKPSGGGTRPFGFEADRVTIRPDEAAVIRELADRFIAGMPLRSLCVDLERRGVRTPTGKPWQPRPLARMLSSARISGQREHRDAIVATAQWPAIIPAEQTARIRAILNDPARRPARAPRSYLLKGLVRCGHCDALMVARPRGDGQRRYVCATGPGQHGCGKSYALADPLEQFVVAAVLHRLDSPELARSLREPRPDTAVDDWQQRADRAVEKLDELAGMYGQGAISSREWIVAREPYQAQLDEARAKVARASNVTAISEWVGRQGVLREQWPTLEIGRRHAIIRAVLVQVRVGPARRGYNRFDPSRFTLLWRH